MSIDYLERLTLYGVMGHRILNKEWAVTDLGPIEKWPQPLLSALDICLSSGSPVSIYWGEDCHLLYNIAWEKEFGAENMLGKPAGEAFEEDWESIGAGVREVFSTGKPSGPGAYRTALNGNGEKLYDFSLSPIIGQDNRSVKGVFSIATKITEQVHAEEKLQKNAERFGEMVDSLPTAIYVTDDEGRLTYYNSAAVVLSGREPEIGTDRWGMTLKLYHTDGSPMPHDESPMALALKEQQNISGAEAIAERPDGERIRFKAYSSPLYDENGNLTGGINMLLDVTSDKEAERNIRRNERDLQDLFDNATIGLHWVDPDGIIKRVNQTELDMLGYSREEYVGRHIEEFHADKEVIDDILTRLKNREELNDYEARLRCKDGSVRHVLINSSVYEEDGEFIHTRCFTRDITEQKKAEQALLESEEKYRTFFESIDEGFCILKMIFDEDDRPVDFRYVEVNSAFKVQAGLDGDVEGHLASEKLPDLEKEWIEIYGNVAQTGQPIRFEDNVTALDRWFSVYAFPTGEEDERLIGVIFKDITERKENEISNAYLSAIVEGSDDAIVSKDLNGNITSWNNSAERIFGYTADEAVGENIRLIIPDDRLEEEDEILEKIRNGKGIDHFETVRQHKDGSFIDVSLTISPIKNSDGEIVGASKITRDITDRKKHEREREQLLRKVETEQKQLTDIFNNAPSFMCVLQGPDHVFKRANNLYLKVVGEDREIIGKPAIEAIPEAEEQGFIDLLDEVYETGEPFIGTDIPVVLHRETDKEPETRYLDFVYQPIYEADGSISGVFVQGVDLTERKRAKQQLKEMNETLEERVEERTQTLKSYQKQLRSLASELSKAEERERRRLAAELHDNLGQILAVGKMKIDLLPREEYSESMSEEVEELRELINNALTYTRELMSDLKPPPSMDEEDIRANLRWVAGKMNKHGLAVDIEDDGKPKPLEEEVKSTLLQCIRELLFNVVRHTEVDKAWIKAEQKDSGIAVTVEDRGSGFNTADLKQTSAEEGGFGLFNVRERIDLLGGSVDIRSVKGEGTSVTIYVPFKEGEEPVLTAVAEEGVSAVPKEGDKRADQRIKVLLVDDHLMVREGLRKIIEDEEDMIVIAEAADGEEAVELAHETRPDVILMDINMPRMGGIEATRKITSEISNVRVIGLSLHDDESVIEDMRSVGATAYLTKTEAFEALCATVRSEAMSKKK